MKKKTTIWSSVFYVVTIICILQYAFIALPIISKTKNVGIGFFLGSLVPNLILVLIFWNIKIRSEKGIVKTIKHVNTKPKKEEYFNELKLKKELNIDKKNNYLMQLRNAKFTSDEVIILTIISSSFSAFVFGHLFGETYYFNWEGYRTENSESFSYKEFHFNYIISITVLVIVGGIVYFILNRKFLKNDK